MTDHWAQLAQRPNIWNAPLRPSPEDITHFQSQILPGSRTLLLGVTSALQPFAAVAVDNNRAAVESNPGQAVFADWADLPFEAEFDAVIGDGSLNVFQGGPERFFAQVKKVLKKPGRLILRIFTSPEEREKIDDVLQAKGNMGFDAFQLRVTNALANPFVAVQDRVRAIKPVWDHPNLEMYRDSSLVYYHPKVSELPRFDAIQYSASYELAERCPIVTWYF